MVIQLFNGELLPRFISERLRMNFDLHNTLNDGSQRMLKGLEVGTNMLIHRLKNVLIGGFIWRDAFTKELPTMDSGNPVHDGETAIDNNQFVETGRVRIGPREGVYSLQIPQGAWHSVRALVPNTQFEAKDGACGG